MLLKLPGLLVIACVLPWTAVAIRHCPVLALNFQDFGIDGCAPSLEVTTPDEVDDILDGATCLGWEGWSIPKEYGCSHPKLSTGVRLQYPCECDFGKACKVSCHKGYQLQGDSNIITCQSNGLWTALPICLIPKCEAPAPPTPVIAIEPNCNYEEGSNCTVSCSGTQYRLKGENIIKCENQKWTPFPDCERFCLASSVPRYLALDGACAGNAKDKCSVRCKNSRLTLIGQGTITCLESGQWSKFPDCGCSANEVPENIVLKPGCSQKVMQKCSADCAPAYYRKGAIDYLICGAAGKWDTSTQSIQCWKMCPEPQIPNDMQLIRACDARRGETCNLKCRERIKKPVGSTTFYCQASGEYTKIEGCAKADQCPIVMDESVVVLGDCTFLYGESCKVACKYKGWELVTSETITCKTTGSWSENPKCKKFCEIPRVGPHVFKRTRGSCRLPVGQACEVQCGIGFHPEAPFSLICQADGTWTGLQECVKMCPDPNALVKGKGLHFPGGCSRVMGSVCKLACKRASDVLLPTNTITCQAPFATWSQLPECMESCDISKFVPPRGTVLGRCSVLYEGRSCYLECIGKKDKFIGDPEVRCKGGRTIVADGIRCVQPCGKFESDALVEQKPHACDFMAVDQSCTVSCKERTARMSGSSVITCKGDGQFSDFPTCERFCQMFSIYDGSYLYGKCSTAIGSVCTVKCVNPNEKIDGESELRVTCLESHAWSKLPTRCEISCGDYKSALHATVQLRLQERGCPGKLNHRCPLKCTNPVAQMYGEPTITCLATGKWSPSPECHLRCREPMLTRMLKFKSECDMRVNSRCELECEKGYVITGQNTITCNPTLNWSPLPSCVWECPDISDAKVTLEKNCNRRAGSTCLATCADGLVMQSARVIGQTTETVTCVESHNWQPPPTCIVSGCDLPGYLKVRDPSCKFKPDTRCVVECVDPQRVLIGPILVHCTPVFQFASVPTCDTLEKSKKYMCQPVEYGKYNIRPRFCTFPHALYSTCVVECVDSSLIMEELNVDSYMLMCEPGEVWNTVPTCVRKCDKAKLMTAAPYLKIVDEFCDVFVGGYCSVLCPPGYYLSDLPAVKCDTNAEWGTLPNCVAATTVQVPRCPPLGIIHPTAEKVNEYDDGRVLAVRPTAYPMRRFRMHTIVCLPSFTWTDDPLEYTAKIREPNVIICPVNPDKTSCHRDFTAVCVFEDPECAVPKLKSVTCLSNGRWSPRDEC